ncbi:MAG TPA: hypothetical protein VEN29_06160 [Casimicrobiaceae bacterium]|nr:hypothetical protein [Casimicrobiaceae bacterium]
MNLRICILLGAWIAMWFAFHFAHPLGYAIAVLGLAASVAIAAEELSDEPRAPRQAKTTLDQARRHLDQSKE